jgi:hypothetical protein
MSSSTPISSGGGGGFCSGEEPIQLIHSKSGKNVYRHDKYGYKVLMCPEEEQPGGAAAAAAPVSEEQILKLVLSRRYHDIYLTGVRSDVLWMLTVLEEIQRCTLSGWKEFH